MDLARMPIMALKQVKRVVFKGREEPILCPANDQHFSVDVFSQAKGIESKEGGFLDEVLFIGFGRPRRGRF